MRPATPHVGLRLGTPLAVSAPDRILLSPSADGYWELEGALTQVREQSISLSRAIAGNGP
jgi:hypothetical protein